MPTGSSRVCERTRTDWKFAPVRTYTAMGGHWKFACVGAYIPIGSLRGCVRTSTRVRGRGRVCAWVWVWECGVVDNDNHSQ